MKTKYTFHQRLSRQSQRGVTLIETLVASAITITAISGAYTYVNTAMAHSKNWQAINASDDMHSTLRSLIRSVVESEGKTDPCLKSHSLSEEMRKRYGEISKHLTLSRFDPSKITSQKKYLGSHYNEWKRASDFCTSSAFGQKACVIIDAQAKENASLRHLVLGVISQSTYDFSSMEPVSSSSCINETVLANSKSEGAGIGIKANYVMLAATIITSGNDEKVTSKRIPGEVVYTLPKLVKTNAASSFDAANTYSCQHDFCNNTLAPDPGIDFQAWKNFPTNSEAYNASICDKCERSPIFK